MGPGRCLQLNSAWPGKLGGSKVLRTDSESKARPAQTDASGRGRRRDVARRLILTLAWLLCRAARPEHARPVTWEHAMRSHPWQVSVHGTHAGLRANFCIPRGCTRNGGVTEPDALMDTATQQRTQNQTSRIATTSLDCAG